MTAYLCQSAAATAAAVAMNPICKLQHTRPNMPAHSNSSQHTAQRWQEMKPEPGKWLCHTFNNKLINCAFHAKEKAHTTNRKLRGKKKKLIFMLAYQLSDIPRKRKKKFAVAEPTHALRAKIISNLQRVSQPASSRQVAYRIYHRKITQGIRTTTTLRVIVQHMVAFVNFLSELLPK